ncbi:hypothetical protein TNCT_535141 [Trichonephila clavata]|uniref:Uncharacterized protein n=1 Tax=Trichonephila clavata TaxID=2740835 RepID=A0A8X6K6F4_TRICU|nr:hypothetical protein TNCT_535141 [Trichonephila clavata]
MLSRIITKDETWPESNIWRDNNKLITPESKQQSMERRHTSSSVTVKAKHTLSKRMQQYSGTGAVFCCWTLLHKEQ